MSRTRTRAIAAERLEALRAGDGGAAGTGVDGDRRPSGVREAVGIGPRAPVEWGASDAGGPLPLPRWLDDAEDLGHPTAGTGDATDSADATSRRDPGEPDELAGGRGERVRAGNARRALEPGSGGGRGFTARVGLEPRSAVVIGIVGLVVLVGTIWSLRSGGDDGARIEHLPPAPTAAVDVAGNARTQGVAGVDAAPRSEAAEPGMRGEPGAVVVSVVGAVARPGLVRLPPGARVADAVEAAGGALPDADVTGVNLARRLDDGDQIVLGTGPAERTGASSVESAGGANRPAGTDGAPTVTGRVDLNSADTAQLEALPGVGPKTAAAIIEWRTRNGRFTDVEQLGLVDGIGPAKLARLRESVRV